MLEAEHLCMTLRGVQKPGAKTVTSALHGLVRDDPRTREEFLSLTGARSRVRRIATRVERSDARPAGRGSTTA